MLIWGSAGKSVDAGSAGTQACPVCKENRSFHHVVTYTMRHIWYLIRWSTGQRHWRRCDTCNNVFEAPAPVVQNAGVDDGSKAKSPIPFFDRWGWALGLGLVAVLIGGAVIAGNADHEADALLVASPVAGDLYQVSINDFAGVPAPTGVPAQAYGVVRVASVTGDAVVIDLPRVVYDRIKGTYGPMRDEARQAAYYDGQMTKTRAELTALFANGVIRDVER